MARRRTIQRRRRRGSFGFLYKLLSVLVICAAIVAALTLFFRVDTIVSHRAAAVYRRGDSWRPPALQQGDNLILFNKYTVAQPTSVSSCPILKKVRINRKLPDTLLIEVTECQQPPGHRPGRQRTG